MIRRPRHRWGPRPAVSRQVRDAARYHLLGEHGRGGLGRISRAHDVDLGRDVAIKELISRNLIGELRFMREALITARLEHPGIVPVYEAGCWADGTPFYAMKLVSGQPLRALIHARDTVDARLGLLHHVTAVANAMAYAHHRHIIHRDLKPSNVIVGELGETVVIDWGLAKDLSAIDLAAVDDPSASPSASPDLTQAGSVMGTPAYMAPEQERGEAVDQRADVYAIGTMLWQLCKVAREPPRDPRVRHRELRRNGIDRDLIAILDKALATDLARRRPRVDVAPRRAVRGPGPRRQRAPGQRLRRRDPAPGVRVDPARDRGVRPRDPRDPAHRFGGPATSAAFAGARVLSSGPDGRLLAWSPGAATPRELLRATQPDGTPRPLIDVTVAGDHVAVGDGAGAIYDVAASGEVRQVVAGGALALRMAADGRAIAVAFDGAIALYDAATWQLLRRFPVPGGIADLVVAPDHRSVLAIQPDGHVQLFAFDGALGFGHDTRGGIVVHDVAALFAAPDR